MAEQGTYIRDVQSLELLSQQLEHSGKTMANIDSDVCKYLHSVKDALDRQLDFIRERLDEAENRLSEAESALSSCEASQVLVPELGEYVPSCIEEEQAVAAAREEVADWQHKHEEAQRIISECQRDIDDYHSPSGGHGLIVNMVQDQTPKATQQLNDCIGKAQDILASDVEVESMQPTQLLNNNPVSEGSHKDESYETFRNSLRGFFK